MFRHGDPGGRIYGSDAYIQKYWGQASAGFAVAADAGRNGGSALHIDTGGGGYLVRTFDNQPTWGIAYALKISESFTANTLLAILDVFTTQIDLRLNTDGTLKLTRNGATLGTSTATLTLDEWAHLELKTTIHPTTGTIELRLDETPIIGPLTNQNTRANSNSYANMIRIGCAASEPYSFDDIIIYDGQTTDPSGNADIYDFIGNCALNWSPPNGAGSSTQFTPDSGSNYSQVSDRNEDTYVESSTLNDIDSYAISNLPANVESVLSLATIHYGRKTDAGYKQAGALIRTGATNYIHPNNIYLSDSNLYYFRNWGCNPNTTAAWTVSDVNGIESGQKVLS